MKPWKNMRTVLLAGALLLCALVLPACGEDQVSPEPEDGVLIYAALNPVSETLNRTIANFNKQHEDVRIEIRDYSDEGGLERLRTELVLGRVPDIMEMHYYGKKGPMVASAQQYHVIPGSYREAEDEYWMPYRQMAQKGYLEDLWPYIENDPDLGREGVLQAPLKAAEVNGGLYIFFQKVSLFTLIGRESVVGARYSWTLEDVMEVYAGMPEGSTIMRYNMTKQDVYFNLLRYSLDRYVDRETGACRFDSQEFRDLIGFLEAFPDKAGYEDPEDAEDEIIRNIKYGRQMLEGFMLEWPRDVCYADSICRERAAFPGFPTANGSSGNLFYPVGTILAMSSTCQNKDVAWEYIRTLVRRRVNKDLAVLISMPVNRRDFEMLCQGDLEQLQWTEKEMPELFEIFLGYPHFPHSPPVRMMQNLSEEDVQRYRELVDHTDQIYWPEDDLTDIVWEVLGPYFAGDRTLDQTVQMLNNRVGLYLKEAM